MPGDRSASSRGQLKRFVDSSDAFANVLNMRREDALFEDGDSGGFGGGQGGGGGGGGKGGTSQPPTTLTMGLDSVAEMLGANRYESVLEQAMATGGSLGMSLRGVNLRQSGVWRTYGGSLRELAPLLPAPYAAAAERFDRRHEGHRRRAEQLVSLLRLDPTSLSKDEAFDEAIFELRAHKFVAPFGLPPFVPPLKRNGEGGGGGGGDGGQNGDGKTKNGNRKGGKARRGGGDGGVGKGWKAEASVWGPRKQWCDAKDFYDTEHVEELKLKLDWSRALACGLEKFIMKNDDDKDGGDADGDGVADELKEVFDVLFRHRNIFFRAFDYYGSLGGDTIGSISLNGTRTRTRTSPRLISVDPSS